MGVTLSIVSHAGKMTVKIICADALAALQDMPERSVHTCVTSPPYWGLRDYGLEPVVWGQASKWLAEICEHEWGEEIEVRREMTVESSTLGFPADGGQRRRSASGLEQDAAARTFQASSAFCRRCNAWRGSLGLEPDPGLYVEHIVQVMRELRRVLRDDGVLWLNLGDSYAGSQKGIGADGTAYGGEKQRTNSGSMGLPVTKDIPGLKPKDLVGIPWRVAFALQADGWWLRSDIVWSKPNPMPESVTDRPTRSHEYIFLLAKKAKYYYDADAIREPAKWAHWGEQTTPKYGGTNTVSGWIGQRGVKDRTLLEGSGRNRRSVWEIATQPYAKAHFATFPEKLVEPCILAGTSERGCCPECGAPWGRVVERVSTGKSYAVGKSQAKRGDGLATAFSGYDDGSSAPEFRTTGWRPTCGHEGEPVPSTVLDPFAGSGTVGLVAERLGRHSVLIDASKDYCQMARERTAQMGLFSAGRTPAKKQPVTPSG